MFIKSESLYDWELQSYTIYPKQPGFCHCSNGEKKSTLQQINMMKETTIDGSENQTYLKPPPTLQ